MSWENAWLSLYCPSNATVSRPFYRNAAKATVWRVQEPTPPNIKKRPRRSGADAKAYCFSFGGLSDGFLFGTMD